MRCTRSGGRGCFEMERLLPPPGDRRRSARQYSYGRDDDVTVGHDEDGSRHWRRRDTSKPIATTFPVRPVRLKRSMSNMGQRFTSSGAGQVVHCSCIHATESAIVLQRDNKTRTMIVTVLVVLTT